MLKILTNVVSIETMELLMPPMAVFVLFFMVVMFVAINKPVGGPSEAGSHLQRLTKETRLGGGYTGDEDLPDWYLGKTATKEKGI